MDNMKDLHELCETVSREIGRVNQKISGGRLSGADIDYIDKLTHTLKSIKTTLAMSEDEGGSYEGSYDGSYDGSYQGSGRYMAQSNRRGGRTGANQYGSYRGYSRAADDFAGKLEDLMAEAPDDQSRKEIERLVSKMRG